MLKIYILIVLSLSSLNAEVFTKAKELCNEGDSYQCLVIGYTFANDLGEIEQAKEYYQKACNLLDDVGCYNLGIAYANEGNYKDAMMFLTKTCEISRDAIGCSDLGYLYEEGLGTEKNLQKAQNIYKQACENKHAHACSRLGVFYANLEKFIDAKKYLKIGCDMNDELGCDNLDTLNLYLDEKQFTSHNEQSILDVIQIKAYIESGCKTQAKLTYALENKHKSFAQQIGINKLYRKCMELANFETKDVPNIDLVIQKLK